MIHRKDIAAHLDKLVRVGYLMGRNEYTPLRSAFVREAPSTAAFEVYTDMNVSPWPKLNSGKQGDGGADERTGAPTSGRINAGRTVEVWGGGEVALRINNLDFEIAIGVTHNSINDDQAGDLETWARQAARTFQKHMDYLCFDALNQGEAVTTYGPCYDGLSFFNDSHVDPSVPYTTTQDNKLATALTLDNFKAAKIAASKFLDGNGQPIGMNHNLLIVPPDLEYEGGNITSNREAYDTANREMNIYAGSNKMLVAPGGWLDTTAWYLIDPNDLIKPLILQVRQAPELDIDDDIFAGDGGMRYYVFKARYAVAYSNWRYALQGNT